MFLLCKVCSSIGNSDPCRQLRHLVTEVVGTEESVAGRDLRYDRFQACDWSVVTFLALSLAENCQVVHSSCRGIG